MTNTQPLNAIADPLARLMSRQDLIWDRVREIAKRERRGLYLHGRGGTGKTVKVENTLQEFGVVYELTRATYTKGGLREYIADCVDRSIEVIVFDDCGPLLKERPNISLFQALLDGKPFGYVRQGQAPTMIDYPGGIIFISNDPMPDGKMAGSLKSKGRVVDYSPADDELAAWMRQWAKGNGGPPRRDLTVAETTEAVEFLIANCLALNAPIDLRLADKTYGDYWAFKHGHTKSHWHVLVISEIQQSIIGATSGKLETPKERMDRERNIVRNIIGTAKSREEQVKLWLEMFPESTGRTFDRRKREIKAQVK
jgi:hypothetical protein